MGGRLLAIALGCLIGLAAVEVGLRLAAYLAAPWMRRSAAPNREAAFRILCLGDSNTYGVGVARAETYPARLQQLLNARDGVPRSQVVNLGVPGTNAAQLLRRLPGYLALYRPHLVVVLVGANEAWNPAGHDASVTSLAARAHRVLSNLRVYRLVLISAATWRSGSKDPLADDVELELKHLRKSGKAETMWELHHGGTTATFRNPARPTPLEADAHEGLLRPVLEAIVREVRSAAVPLVLATYAAESGPYASANRAIRAVAAALGVPIADAHGLADTPAAGAGPLFFPDLHPRAAAYAAFAVRLRDVLLDAGLVPG
jgi:lysophospholipase L1-like esterase